MWNMGYTIRPRNSWMEKRMNRKVIIFVESISYSGFIRDEDQNFLVLRTFEGKIIKINKKFVRKIVFEKEGLDE